MLQTHFRIKVNYWLPDNQEWKLEPQVMAEGGYIMLTIRLNAFGLKFKM